MCSVVGGSKYIAVRKQRKRHKAQKYCSEKYKNGSLGSGKDKSDRTEIANLMKAESLYFRNNCLAGPFLETNANYSYWTFSEGSCNSYDGGDNVSTSAAFGWHNDSLVLQGATRDNATRFICQVNKGKETCSWSMTCMYCNFTEIVNIKTYLINTIDDI